MSLSREKLQQRPLVFRQLSGCIEKKLKSNSRKITRKKTVFKKNKMLFLNPMRLVYLFSAILLLWKRSDAADSTHYNITVGSVSSTCESSFITPKSLSVGCGDDGVCKVGDSIVLDAVGEIYSNDGIPIN